MSREFKDALNTYYSLKSQYQNNFTKEKNKIINTIGMSWREKRIEYQRLKKKCINCKRPVGSIFETKLKGDTRHLIALCGDRANPCPLNIDINVGFFDDISSYIQEDETLITKYKSIIIKDKNDLLFGYIDSQTAVSRFDQIKENISKIMSSYEFTLNLYMNIVNNKEKKNELNKHQAELFLNITNFKKLIHNFERTQDTQFVIEALELYKTEIIPKANKVMNEKYAYSAVEYNESDDTYLLIQRPVTLEHLEWDLGETEPGIVSMKIGVDKFQMLGKSQSRSDVLQSAIPALKKKSVTSVTRKPVLKVLEESEESEESESESEKSEEEEEEEEEVKPKITIQPQLLQDGSISESEANRLRYKIEVVNNELIATNERTGKTYKVVG